MTHEDYIGYALDLVDADERTAMETHLAANPDAAMYLERVRAAVAPLETDREDDAPPQGLATRTISRLAAELVEMEPRTSKESTSPSSLEIARKAMAADRVDTRSIGGRFRLDIFVALGIGLCAVGLAMSFVSRARQASELMACQNNLRTLHQGLSSYADTHEGRFPQVGTETYPTAGSFVQALKDAGQCPPGFHAVCPAAANASPSQVSYAYPLGHRSPNNVVLGEWRSKDPAAENDLLPIGADYPIASVSPGDGPTSGHRSGHNVLYMGGNVRYANVATVGVNGDDIYRNQFGEVAAGLNRVDSVLGRSGDVP